MSTQWAQWFRILIPYPFVLAPISPGRRVEGRAGIGARCPRYGFHSGVNLRDSRQVTHPRDNFLQFFEWSSSFLS